MKFIRYLKNLWHGEEDAKRIAKAYHNTFTSIDGAMVLEHLVNNVYATVCDTHDPIALAAHNGRRSVVQDILLNVEAARHPEKAEVKVETKDPDRKAA